MMKPKVWKKRRRSGMNAPRGTRRATRGSSSGECVDTRNNLWIPTLIQLWIISFPMLLPMGGSTFNVMSIPSIGWRSREVYLIMCLPIKYIIGWLCTWKVRSRIQVTGLVSWKNRGLIQVLRKFSLFFTLINCIAIVTSQSRWQIISPRDSTTWRIRTRRM